MKYFISILLLTLAQSLSSQAWLDTWIKSQLGEITWKGSYKGVLADFHPVTIVLASDRTHVVGYLIHEGDQRKHKLIGEWSNTDRIQLQERDEYDRLAGYLTGSVTGDQVLMEWMSADQSRLFNIKAFPESLIRIKNFKPMAEWIEIPSTPKLLLSVQKLDYGVVSGVSARGKIYSRFEGYCLDGTCSIWNTVIQNPIGAPIRVQMRQKDAGSYKVTLNGVDYTGTILSSTPLAIRQFDNSMGFLDFVYPKFTSQAYDQWLGRWIDKLWAEGVAYLTRINKAEGPGRLIHRSSGWVEILQEGDQYVSGMITYINPGATRREIFVWIKKEDVFLSQADLVNMADDIKQGSGIALKARSNEEDEEYRGWLDKTGYAFMLPTAQGALMITEFSMMYGDDIKLISLETSKNYIKKKYWRYFGW